MLILVVAEAYRAEDFDKTNIHLHQMDFRRGNYIEETTLSFRLLLFFSLLCIFPAELDSISDINSAAGSVNNIEIPVGVIVDEGSWVGKTVEISISIAISDFYELHSHYKTRVVLHTRNSEGDPLRTLSAGTFFDPQILRSFTSY